MTAASVHAASNGMDLEGFEALLRERRDALSDVVRALEREEAGAEDASGLAADLAEQGSGLSVHDVNLSRLESIAQEIREIDEALARVREGAYGVCENCEGTIARERLEAIPYATLCLACKAADEGRGG